MNDPPKMVYRSTAINNVIYYIPEITNIETIKIKGITEYHEMWHMKQAEEFKNKGGYITDENYGEYLKKLNKKCKRTIDTLGINEYNVEKISNYAKMSYFSCRYDEVEAEYMALRKMKGEKLW